MKLLFNNQTHYSNILMLMLCLQASLHGMQETSPPLLQSQHYDQPPPRYQSADNSVPSSLPRAQAVQRAPDNENMDRDDKLYGTGYCNTCKQRQVRRICVEWCAFCAFWPCLCCAHCIFCRCCHDENDSRGADNCYQECLHSCECCACCICRCVPFYCKDEFDTRGNFVAKCSCCTIAQRPEDQRFQRYSCCPCCCYAQDADQISCLITDECCLGECYQHKCKRCAYDPSDQKSKK